MPRTSRGCLPCRKRHVRCDEAKPSCARCIKRKEVCTGYRDADSLIFRHETDQTIDRLQSLNSTTTSPLASTGAAIPSTVSATSPQKEHDLKWTESSSSSHLATSKFFEKYATPVCSDASLAPFLQHLPCMFEEANIPGRFALRYAVQAASYADLGQQKDDHAMIHQALKFYGLCLSALSESLRIPGKVPDDYDLMAVVILDIFEVGSTI